MLKKQDKSDISIPKPEWKKVEDGHYGEDHVINAYLSGRESAIQEISNALTRQKVALLKRGMETTDQFLDILKSSHDVSFEKVFLRQTDFKNIDVIIVVPQDLYFSDKMTTIYEEGFKTEEDTEDIELSISYTYNLQDLDTSKMAHDGYIFSREP